ncbi:MAG: hypothetical protein Q8L90_01150 [Bacteroidota bacterium]|nr:hypothetical protein [Bacteroidota bacterium]
MPTAKQNHLQEVQLFLFIYDHFCRSVDWNITTALTFIDKAIRLRCCITTHDIELTSLANQFPENVRNLCFEITISDDKLNFDYKIKDGVCKDFPFAIKNHSL